MIDNFLFRAISNQGATRKPSMQGSATPAASDRQSNHRINMCQHAVIVRQVLAKKKKEEMSSCFVRTDIDDVCLL